VKSFQIECNETNDFIFERYNKDPDDVRKCLDEVMQNFDVIKTY